MIGAFSYLSMNIKYLFPFYHGVCIVNAKICPSMVTPLILLDGKG